jgi:hypothetical protein
MGPSTGGTGRRSREALTLNIMTASPNTAADAIPVFRFQLGGLLHQPPAGLQT